MFTLRRNERADAIGEEPGLVGDVRKVRGGHINLQHDFDPKISWHNITFMDCLCLSPCRRQDDQGGKDSQYVLAQLIKDSDCKSEEDVFRPR